MHHGYCSHHDASNGDLIKELIYEKDMFIGILTNPNAEQGSENQSVDFYLSYKKNKFKTMCKKQRNSIKDH